MNADILCVESMKKIGLRLEAGTAPDQMDLTPEPLTIRFIFGIDSQGLSPFEYALVGKRPGDHTTVRIERDAAPSYLAHLTGPILRHVNSNGGFFLKAAITEVQTPDSREIVKAMAEKTSCGDGCDCGCGCSI